MSFWSRIERRIEDIAGDLIPDEFRERLSQAQGILEAGDIAGAEELLQSLVSSRPGHAAAQTLLGATQLKLNKLELASDSFDKALALDSSLPEALIGRGNTAIASNQGEAAVPYFRDAIEASGGDRELLAEVYHGLGRAYRLTGELGKAIRELRKAVAESNGDAAVIADLGDALSVDGSRSHGEASRYLERLSDREGCPPVAWLALGRIALRDGDLVTAVEHFERVLASADLNAGDEEADSNYELFSQAYLWLAKAELELGKGEEAIRSLQSILDLENSEISQVEIFAKMGQAHELLGDTANAMTLYRRSLTGEAADALHEETAKRALRLALQHQDIEAGVEMANRVMEYDADDANALTARGLQLASIGQVEPARATFEHALLAGANYESFLALAALELNAGDLEQAREHAAQALRERPKSERARDLLNSCQSAALGVELKEESSWYDLASATVRLCTQDPALLSLRQDASRTLAEYDQPLLVAVMGEFSSGKSSFVNAFVGTEVAPTGIIPTTATINIVKYGRSKSGRVVYRDNTSRDVSGKKLFETLSLIDGDEARRVQHVEILMPIDVLERVNIIDTPGLNSILPEHEAVARSFLKRADAVVWIFTVNQAGKSTEKLALDSIRETGVRVLGVLNKVDQLTGDQVQEVLNYVAVELGDRVEACIPVSTRRAISGEADSGWDAMREELDERFFKQARAIKKQALNRRLEGLLSNAHDLASKANSQSNDQCSSLRAASDKAQESMLQFVGEVVEQERKLIGRDAGLLYRSAAREILELVRPRKLPFGSHKATQADRDYLLGLLDSGFEALLRDSRDRCTTILQSNVDAIVDPHHKELEPVREALDTQVREGLRLIQAQVWTRSLAFIRGYLRGGFVDNFFQVELAKIDLNEDAIYHALFRSAPELDRQLSLPLANAGGELLGELSSFLQSQSDIAEVKFLATDSGLQRAIAALIDHRISLSGQLDLQ